MDTFKPTAIKWIKRFALIILGMVLASLGGTSTPAETATPAPAVTTTITTPAQTVDADSALSLTWTALGSDGQAASCSLYGMGGGYDSAAVWGLMAATYPGYADNGIVVEGLTQSKAEAFLAGHCN